MAYTIANQNQSFFSKIKPLLTYLVLFAVLGGIAYGVTIGMQQVPGLKQKSALTVQTQYDTAEVYVDGEKVGESPLEKFSVEPGTHEIKLVGAEAEFIDRLDFNPEVETALQRDTGVSAVFASGMNFVMEKDATTLTVISQPSGATVYLDGTEMGETPLTLDKVTEGSYTLDVRMEGYEGQSAPIQVKDGYKLMVSAKLFPIPMPKTIQKFEGSENLYDLTISNESFGTSPDRAKAVVYWADTRGFSDVGNAAELESAGGFDFFLDSAGNVYDNLGNLVSTQEGFEALQEADVGGYLGVGTLGAGLTEPAKETYLELFEARQMGKILPTGLGWLRVRTEPSLGAAELTKVNVGESFPVLEVQGTWVKLQVTADEAGWVSATYVEIE
ncbi:PEGA domain-containing protein [candidate division WWE3 bacterium]|nr:PEGA domain-containing protein [candidate division WWE3 bacterium]